MTGLRRAVLIRVISGRQQLFLRILADGAEQQISFDAADHEDPAGSPDGRHIAFVLVKENSKVVHLIAADGSGDQTITPPTQSAIHPSFTADGKSILYCTDDDLRPPAKNESSIPAIDPASRRVTLAATQGRGTAPKWSADGKTVHFTICRQSQEHRGCDIYSADVSS